MKAAITSLARWAVITIALFIWVFVFVHWVFKFTRVSLAYSLGIVRYLLTGENPPDRHYLDNVAMFWFRGFREIVYIFDDDRKAQPLFASTPQAAIWLELLISCILCTWIIATWSLRNYWTAFFVWLFSGMWNLIILLSAWGIYLLRLIPNFPF